MSSALCVLFMLQNPVTLKAFPIAPSRGRSVKVPLGREQNIVISYPICQGSVTSVWCYSWFVTEPWYSRHVLFSREHAASSTLEPCALSHMRALFHVGVWCSDPGTHVLSLSFRVGGSDTRAPCFVSLCDVRSPVRSAARSSVHVCLVVLWVHHVMACAV